MKLTKQYVNELSFKVIGAAIAVHKSMGIGLLESVYHQCLIEELKYRKIKYATEMKIPVIYRSLKLNIDFRCDLFVEDCLLVEIKSVIEIHSVHEAQLLNYMNLLKSPKGILINFNCLNIFNEGQKTFVNKYFEELAAI